jgi:hypothetical protein
VENSIFFLDFGAFGIATSAIATTPSNLSVPSGALAPLFSLDQLLRISNAIAVRSLPVR